jgi:predicted kinase
MIIVITGVMAAGKSTVAQLLAESLDKSVHLRGDIFRRMVVGGRAEMTPLPSRAAEDQLQLRYRLSAQVADGYAAAGFTVVVQDVILGPDLRTYLSLIETRPCHVVVLAPRPEVVAAREAARAKTGYGEWTVAALQASLDETPRIGHWIDNSAQTPAETVRQIIEACRSR